MVPATIVATEFCEIVGIAGVTDPRQATVVPRTAKAVAKSCFLLMVKFSFNGDKV
jgi:hypothetical protein